LCAFLLGILCFLQNKVWKMSLLVSIYFSKWDIDISLFSAYHFQGRFAKTCILGGKGHFLRIAPSIRLVLGLGLAISFIK